VGHPQLLDPTSPQAQSIAHRPDDPYQSDEDPKLNELLIESSQPKGLPATSMLPIIGSPFAGLVSPKGFENESPKSEPLSKLLLPEYISSNMKELLRC
jgi:hypothetical protein